MTGMQLHAEDNYLIQLNTITKLVITLFFSIFVVFIKTESALLVLFGASVLYVAPLKKWKAMLIGYAIIIVMYLSSIFFTTLLTLVGEKFGVDENFELLIPFLRVAIMINLSLALTLSSGVRKLTNVLKTIKTPRFIYLPAIVVFRFVPSFINDIKQIHQSIKLKIGSINFIMMVTRPKLFIRLMIIPAVVRALRSAEELSAAAEIKGISDSDGIKNSTPEFWTWKDFLAFTITIVLSIAVVLLNTTEGYV